MMSFDMKKVSLGRSFLSLFLLFSLIVPLSACDLSQNYLKADREGGHEVQDYRDALSSRVDEEASDDAEHPDMFAPALQPYIANANTRMKSMPLVSVSVNQTVPLRDVLYELAEQAEYDLELDPKIRGAIIFTARSRPFDEVVGRIADIAGLRYKIADDVLRVEVDTPYNNLYKIDYLSYLRESSTTISTDVSVVSGEGLDSGSGFQATSESSIDFWGEVEANLEQILGGATSNSLTTRNNPRITATAQNPDVATVAPTDGAQSYNAPDATLNIGALPLDEEPVEDVVATDSFTFSLNKQAGMINVYANEKSHKEIANYLIELRRSVTSQVLIEAKILEVQLNDEHATGIDWSHLGVNGNMATGLLGTNSGILGNLSGVAARAASTGGVFTGNTNFAINYAGDVDVLVEALAGFGTVKALASPRLTVLNNQPAMLNVSTNRVFFDVDIDVTTDDGATQTEISSESNSVPEGVLVNVQPSIDLKNRTISMAVRPTITEVVNTVDDPAVQYITAVNNVTGVTSTLPELNVQEIDSVIQVRSGQPVVMGGLLQDRVAGTQEGIPILSEIPLAGALFRNQSDLINKTEIVIFLKATILETPGDSVHAADKDLYRKFSSDRRPLKF